MLATKTAKSFSWSRENGLAIFWRISGEVRRVSNRASGLAFPAFVAVTAGGISEVFPASMT